MSWRGGLRAGGFGRFLETPQADLETLDTQADELSALLMKRSEMTTHLRRIACVDVELCADGKLHGSRRRHHIASTQIP